MAIIESVKIIINFIKKFKNKLKYPKNKSTLLILSLLYIMFTLFSTTIGALGIIISCALFLFICWQLPYQSSQELNRMVLMGGFLSLLLNFIVKDIMDILFFEKTFPYCTMISFLFFAIPIVCVIAYNYNAIKIGKNKYINYCDIFTEEEFVKFKKQIGAIEEKENTTKKQFYHKDILIKYDYIPSTTFKTNKKAKFKTAKKVVRNTTKFQIWRLISVLLFLSSIGIGIYELVFVDSIYEPTKFFWCTILSTTFLIVPIFIMAFLYNFGSIEIDDRLNEHMWIENEILHHFWQVSFAAGYNSWNTDSTGQEFQLDINSIYGCKYNPKTKKIEFYASGRQVLYSDFVTKKVKSIHPLYNSVYKHSFYDYYNPSVIDTFKNAKIPIEKSNF